MSMQVLRDAAAAAWAGLDRDDWLQAFSAHPRLGERGDRPMSAWSRDEQSGTAGADADLLAALEAENRDYEQRFGHVFLLFADGLSAEAMLTALRTRIGNDAATELRLAADEQQKITDLRLTRLLRP